MRTVIEYAVAVFIMIVIAVGITIAFVSVYP